MKLPAECGLFIQDIQFEPFKQVIYFSFDILTRANIIYSTIVRKGYRTSSKVYKKQDDHKVLNYNQHEVKESIIFFIVEI